MIASRCKGLCAAGVVVGAFLAGCGSAGTSAGTSTGGSTGSATATSQAAICASVGKLKADIVGLKDINIRANGTSAVSDQLSKIQQQFDTVKNDAQGQFSPQVTALSNALHGLNSSLTAAKDNLNGGTLAALASASGTVVTAGNNLVTAVLHTC